MKKISVFLTLVCLTWNSYGQNPNFNIYEEIDNCINSLSLDRNTGDLYMTSGLLSGDELIVRRATNGVEENLKELYPNLDPVGVQEVTVIDGVVTYASYKEVSFIELDSEEAYIFNSDASDLSNGNSVTTALYDPNADVIYAGDQIWGLEMYDGYSWQQIDEISKVLCSHYDPISGFITFGASDGKIFTVDGDQEMSLINEDYDIPQIPFIDVALYIDEEDEESTMLVAVSSSQGIVVISEAGATHYTSENSGLFSGTIDAVAIDSKKRIYIGHGGGFSILVADEFTVYPSESLFGEFYSVSDIIIDEDDHAWMGVCGTLIELWFDDVSTSTDNLQTNNFNLYYSKGNIHINSDSSGELQIYDQLGRIVHRGQYNEGDSMIRTSLTMGIYYYKSINESRQSNGNVWID